MKKYSHNIKLGFSILFVLFTALLLSGCTAAHPSRIPLGEPFPHVQATVLGGEEVEIPSLFQGKQILLLVGFVQEAQFDVDRWVLALKQLKTPVAIAEIPAIQGLFPRVISGTINQGMKDGIPEEDWRIVFTVYKDSEKIAKFVGNSKPRNVRVVLLDKAGIVRWFHDRGFSADRAIELDKLAREGVAKVQ